MPLDGPRDWDLGRAQQGIASVHALEMIERTLLDGRKTVEDRIFQELDAGTLTGTDALMAWAQLREMARIRKTLQAAVKKGERASDRAASDLKAVGDAPPKGAA